MSDGAITRLTQADAGEIYTLQLAAYLSQGRLHDDYRIPPLVQTFEELVEELEDPDVTPWASVRAGVWWRRCGCMFRV